MARTDFVGRFVRLRNRTTGEQRFPGAMDLRARLAADAVTEETNLTDVAIKILCKQFNVLYIPAPRRTKPTEDQYALNLNLPRDLDAAIDAAATARRRTSGMRAWTVPDEIVAALCRHYGIRAPIKSAKVRSTRQPRRAAPAAA